MILAGESDFTSALQCFNKAIELKPDFGEAYYNRGYVFLSLGNRDAAFADLSRAGGLGIVPSYNLLKRMSVITLTKCNICEVFSVTLAIIFNKYHVLKIEKG